MKRKQDAGEAVKHLGHGKVDSFSKSNTLANYTDDPTVINKCVYSLLKSFQILYSDVRGIGIQVTRLDSNQEILPRKIIFF